MKLLVFFVLFASLLLIKSLHDTPPTRTPAERLAAVCQDSEEGKKWAEDFVRSGGASLSDFALTASYRGGCKFLVTGNAYLNAEAKESLRNAGRSHLIAPSRVSRMVEFHEAIRDGFQMSSYDFKE